MEDDFVFSHKENKRTAIARDFFLDSQELSPEDCHKRQSFSEYLDYAPKDIQGFGMFIEIPGSSCYALVATDRFWSFFQSIVNPDLTYSVNDLLTFLSRPKGHHRTC
jgi:hypothetical protein